MQSAVTDTLFKSGRILMPLEPTGTTLETIHQWSDSIVVCTLIITFTILAIVNLRNFVMIVPSLFESFLRAKGSSVIENKVVLVRARSITSLVLLVPFCLIADRYRLLDIEYLNNLSPNLALAATIGAFLIYIIMRSFLAWQLAPKSRKKEAWYIAHRASHTFFIIVTVLELIAAGIMSLLGTPDSTCRIIIYYIIAFVYAVCILRKCQILSASCNSFTIILYLCALEIIPTGLIISAVKFL